MAKWIALIFSVFVFLMMVFDFTQIAQWVGVAFDLGTALMLSAMRGPGIAETILPFAVLFAAMAAFFQMNRRLELTVTRAAGLSAWQILFPASIVALLVGVIATTIYNPGAAALRDRSVEIGGFGPRQYCLQQWRVRFGCARTVATAHRSSAPRRTGRGGTVLAGATAFVFADDGSLRLRVDAPSATLQDDEWVFEQPSVIELGQPPRVDEEFRLHTFLSLEQIRESLADPGTVPFWQLPPIDRHRRGKRIAGGWTTPPMARTTVVAVSTCSDGLDCRDILTSFLANT